MKIRVRPLAVLFLAPFLAACATSYHWVHPTVPESQWRRDIAGCEAYANDKADRSFGRNGDPSGRFGNSLTAEMNRYDAVENRDRIAAACLRDRGYERVKVKAE